MLKRKFIGVLTGLLLCVASMQAQQHWQCNVHDFQYDMTVYAALQLNGQGVAASEAYEVAAFCGEECRGIATAESIPGTDSTYYYLRIRSNVIAGDSITFKYYDPSTDEEIELNESLTFVSQSIAGFPSSPFTLTGEANVTMGDVNGDSRVSIADYTMTINDILGLPNVGFIDKAADLNNDGRISIADAIMIVNIILGI